MFSMRGNLIFSVIVCYQFERVTIIKVVFPNDYTSSRSQALARRALPVNEHVPRADTGHETACRSPEC